MYNVQRRQHSPAGRLVVLLYVVDLSCFPHATKWRCRERSSTALKAYSLWNLCKAAPSVRWRCTTRQCWLNCGSTLQRNGLNFIGLGGDNAQPHVMQFLAKFNITALQPRSCSLWLLLIPINKDKALGISIWDLWSSAEEKWVVYNKENLERQETNKYGRGTERHLPKTEESIIRPAGVHR